MARFEDVHYISCTTFESPELGPLGTHGLANARDFEYPVASFDVDLALGRVRLLCTFSND